MQPMQPILTQHSAQSFLDFRLAHLINRLLTGMWLHDTLAPPMEIHKF